MNVACDNKNFYAFRPDQESQKIFKEKNSIDGEQMKIKVFTGFSSFLFYVRPYSCIPCFCKYCTSTARITVNVSQLTWLEINCSEIVWRTPHRSTIFMENVLINQGLAYLIWNVFMNIRPFICANMLIVMANLRFSRLIQHGLMDSRPVISIQNVWWTPALLVLSGFFSRNSRRASLIPTGLANLMRSKTM